MFQGNTSTVLESGRTTASKSRRASSIAGTNEAQDLSQMKGGALLMWLDRVALSRGHSRQDVARELGVTYGYLAQLRSGIREVANISDDFAYACSLYLKAPRITVLKAAGRITIEDYIDPSAGTGLIDRALETMRADPDWGGFLPQDIFEGSYAVKRYVVMLYERATGKKLMTQTDLSAITGKKPS